MAQLEKDACWAVGLDVVTTGLARTERQQLQAVAEAAGGRRARIKLPRGCICVQDATPAHMREP